MRTRTLATAGAALTAGLLLTACAGNNGKPVAASASATVTATATPTATPSTAPAPTTTAAPRPTKVKARAKPKRSDTGCGPERDVVVWMKTPGVPAMAQVLGSYNLTTCEPTFKWLQETSPTEPGNCTEAAWASDNPGYNADAEPAKQPRKVQMAVGPAC